MKEAFKMCMLYLYPGGVANPLQHRDLVRCFCMGWIEALKHHNTLTDQELDKLAEIAKEDWMPDSSWNWIGNELCTNCKDKSSEPLHICPYKSDIHEDNETLCNCCNSCTRECLDDILSFSLILI
jgi:hypothetical protein